MTVTSSEKAQRTRRRSKASVAAGLGALAALGIIAPATDATAVMRVPQQSGKGLEELILWLDNGGVYLSANSGPAQLLNLGDTAEMQRLKEMLGRANATRDAPVVVRERLLLVGGGGSGYGWGKAGQGNSSSSDQSSSSPPPPPNGGSAPQK